MKAKNWFDVDRDGLRELHSAFPLERMVMELIQNCWDESASLCAVEIERRDRLVVVSVRDDNPDGFQDLCDAYTLFRSTRKRSDPEKRGRYNCGEKFVIAQARRASIVSTRGSVIFDDKGRRRSCVCTPCGTVVTVELAGSYVRQVEEALRFLSRLIPPAKCTTTVNGKTLVAPKPLVVHGCTLPTEIVTETAGTRTVTRTSRKTTLSLYEKRAAEPMIYEMGLPVCAVDGAYDIDIGQKVPVSQDRTTLSVAFLRDVYAETVNAANGVLPVATMGTAVIKTALESQRVTPNTAAAVLREAYGPDAVLQSHDPDSDQLAVRNGCTLVPSRTFGADVNGKLRTGGMATAKEKFGRKIDGCWRAVEFTTDSQLANFVRYVNALGEMLYPGTDWRVSIAEDLGSANAQNEGGNHLVFSVKCIASGERPVSEHTVLIVHELSHCAGSGHDGVYDHEHERNMKKVFCRALREPGFFGRFEPGALP